MIIDFNQSINQTISEPTMIIDFNQSINQSIKPSVNQWWLLIPINQSINRSNYGIPLWRRIHLLLPFPGRQQPQLVWPHFSYSHCSTTRDADRWDPQWWPAVRGTVDDTSSSTADMSTACSPPIHSTSYTKPKKRKFRDFSLVWSSEEAKRVHWLALGTSVLQKQVVNDGGRAAGRGIRECVVPVQRDDIGEWDGCSGVVRELVAQCDELRWRGAEHASAERPVSPFWLSLLLLHRFLSAPMRLTDWTEPVVLPSSMPVTKTRKKMFVSNQIMPW